MKIKQSDRFLSKIVSILQEYKSVVKNKFGWERNDYYKLIKCFYNFLTEVADFE